ncbi:hypothetical protein FQN60_000699 [Etheostoma spectabile]|uniref:Uncharacterized protein n=1 Tax=Etheostoma spectabile TaxID=54343 RepID=A0A5J5D122_9PERO|nr:hypothetical protein FQN60_000699 [Etheostoma spectabile]
MGSMGPRPSPRPISEPFKEPATWPSSPMPESVCGRPARGESSTGVGVCLSRRRHCLISPPDDMFFSASISLKLRELANTSTSTMAMRRDRKAYEAAVDLQFSLLPQRGRVEPLTEGEVAADRRGRMPPQAMMMLSTI